MENDLIECQWPNCQRKATASIWSADELEKANVCRLHRRAVIKRLEQSKQLLPDSASKKMPDFIVPGQKRKTVKKLPKEKTWEQESVDKAEEVIDRKNKSVPIIDLPDITPRRSDG